MTCDWFYSSKDDTNSEVNECKDIEAPSVQSMDNIEDVNNQDHKLKELFEKYICDQEMSKRETNAARLIQKHAYNMLWSKILRKYPNVVMR